MAAFPSGFTAVELAGIAFIDRVTGVMAAGAIGSDTASTIRIMAIVGFTEAIGVSTGSASSFMSVREGCTAGPIAAYTVSIAATGMCAGVTTASGPTGHGTTPSSPITVVGAPAAHHSFD